LLATTPDRPLAKSHRIRASGTQATMRQGKTYVMNDMQETRITVINPIGNSLSVWAVRNKNLEARAIADSSEAAFRALRSAGHKDFSLFIIHDSSFILSQPPRIQRESAGRWGYKCGLNNQ
jgi:hypothetical protein